MKRWARGEQGVIRSGPVPLISLYLPLLHRPSGSTREGWIACAAAPSRQGNREKQKENIEEKMDVRHRQKTKGEPKRAGREPHRNQARKENGNKRKKA